LICGLILAAGAGTRFGDKPKQLAELEGRPLLDHAIAAQCAVPELERIAVVLGAFAEQILERVDFIRAEPVVCESWADGQAASLRRGIEYLSAEVHVNKLIVTLGDQPRMTSELIARFADEPPATRAVYDRRPGHPVVLGPVQMRLIGNMHGDHGARHLLRGGKTIECGHLLSARDVDTPEDLEAIRNEARAVV
jgi:CTP:molybdopterin cytidylyltransferase MocA